MKKNFNYVIFIISCCILISCNKNNDKPDKSIQFNPNVTYGTVTDVEGNVYKTVTIGYQTWMAENLRTTKYNNGDTIPNIKDDVDWHYTMQGAYCDYDNNPSNSKIYGKLYNEYTLFDSRKIAPEGWHIPSLSEWTTLFIYLGGINNAANKMKEVGVTHWNETVSYQNNVKYSNISTNESGFTAIGAGIRYRGTSNAWFDGIDKLGYFWTSTISENNAYHVLLNSYEGVIVTSRYFGSGDYNSQNQGISIRCVKDYN
jgi:uncharacterized protein (TIGR02145 family)